MTKAVRIDDALSGLSMFRGRTPESSGDDLDAAFARLASTENGGVFAGSFQGESAWERHGNGDELVHVLEGETTLTILHDDGEDELRLTGGMMTVVPRGCWHRFQAPDGVTVMTMTPQPTDHSTSTDPRKSDL